MAIRVITRNGGNCHINDLIEALTKELASNKRMVANVRQNKLKLDSEDFTREDGTPLFKRDPDDPDVWMVVDSRVSTCFQHNSLNPFNSNIT